MAELGWYRGSFISLRPDLFGRGLFCFFVLYGNDKRLFYGFIFKVRPYFKKH